MSSENSEVPPSEDVALTYPNWKKALEMLSEKGSTTVERQLAVMAAELIEINKHDPDTIVYLNARGLKAMEARA